MHVRPLVTTLIISGIWAAGVLLTGCQQRIAQDDRDHLKTLNERWSGRYQFDFDGDLYLKMVNQRGESVPESDAREAYNAFWFDAPVAQMRATSFAYLNVYGVSREFQYQIAYDQRTRRFVLSHSEHY